MLERLAPGVIIIRYLLETLGGRVLALRFDRDRRFTKVIEQRVHALVKQWQPMLHAGMAAAFADSLIKLIVAFGRAKGRDIAHPEAANGFGRELKFRNRNQIERAHVERRSLRLRIETADRFQIIAEEIEANRQIESGRKQIEDAAAHRIFTGFSHRRGPAI